MAIRNRWRRVIGARASTARWIGWAVLLSCALSVSIGESLRFIGEIELAGRGSGPATSVRPDPWGQGSIVWLTEGHPGSFLVGSRAAHAAGGASVLPVHRAPGRPAGRGEPMPLRLSFCSLRRVGAALMMGGEEDGDFLDPFPERLLRT